MMDELDTPYVYCNTVKLSDNMETIVLEVNQPVELWWMRCVVEPTGDSHETDLVTVTLWDEHDRRTCECYLSRNMLSEVWLKDSNLTGKFQVTANCGLDCNIGVKLGYDTEGKIDQYVCP